MIRVILIFIPGITGGPTITFIFIFIFFLKFCLKTYI
jgi:hypothetical protein